MTEEEQLNQWWAISSANGRAQLTRLWNGYLVDFNDHVTAIRDGQQKNCEEFYGRWAQLSHDIQTRLSSLMSSNPKEYRELYTTWKNFQNKLQARLLNLMTVEYSLYQGLVDFWKETTDDLLQKISMPVERKDEIVVKGSIMFDVYNHWGTNSRAMAQRINVAKKNVYREYEELGETWQALLKSFSDEIAAISTKAPDHERVMDVWDIITLKMGIDLSRFLRAGSESTETVGSIWHNISQQIDDDLVMTIGKIDYEEFYSNLYGQLDFVPVDHNNTDKWYRLMRQELDGLRVQIETIEKNMEPHSDGTDLQKLMNRR